jgi:diaminopimelate epimerase
LSFKVPFEKWTGAGNDFILLRKEELTGQFDPVALAQRLCDRFFGIGADGLVILSGNRAEFWNCDGSEAAFCGNASRCIGKSINRRRTQNSTSAEKQATENETTFKLRKIEVTATIEVDPMVSVTVPEPNPGSTKVEDESMIKLRAIPIGKEVIENVYSIVAGVPHLVIILNPGIDIQKSGFELLAYTAMDGEEVDSETGRHNVTMVQSDTGAGVGAIRTWELGIDGETLACGSGALAAAAALGSEIRQIRLRTAGGAVLEVEKSELKWRLRGPAEHICQGVAEL